MSEVPEHFINFFDDMGKWELIEILWNRMTQEERDAILDRDKDDEDDNDECENCGADIELNLLERFWIDSGLLNDILTNADPLEFGETDWTPKSLKALCTQQVIAEREMAGNGDENSVEWIKSYDAIVEKNLTVDYPKLYRMMN